MQQGEALLRAAAVIGESFSADLLADVTGADRTDALDGIAECAPAGLVDVDAAGGRFRDASVRAELYARIPPSERAKLHTRVADVLIRWHGSGESVQPEEIARHLIASGATDRRAAEFLVAAGDQAMGRRRYDAAEAQYEAAIDALRGARDADAVSAVSAIGLGTARLAGGNMAAAREAFQRAIEPARRAERGDLLAKAALGLGSGATGFEVALVDRVQLDALHESLATLAAGETSLRSLVLSRLAVATTLLEDDQRRRDYAAQAVELARAAADRAALGTALAAQCDAYSGSEHPHLRKGLADEIVSVAATVNDREMELLGRRHRLVALAETGDMEGVDAEIRDFAALSDVLQQPLYAWYVPLWRGMRALMSGRIDECRQRIESAAAIGATAGSRNAYVLTATLRWCLLSETADRPGIEATARELDIADEPGIWAGVALALMAAEAGRAAEARTRLDSVAPRLANAPRDSEWVPMLAQVAELIGHLGGHPVASWTYEALRPYAEQLVVEGIGAAIRGSLHRHMGLLAAALGDTRRAATHFAAAVDVHSAIGAPLLVARTYRDWGIALRNRDPLTEALTRYEQMGIAARLAELQAALGAVEPSAPAAARSEQQCLAREGEMWSLTYAGRTVRLRDAKGLRDIARLVAATGRAIPAVELAASNAVGLRPAVAASENLRQGGDLGELLDPTARAAYRQRLADLEDEISEAESMGDGERVAEFKTERDMLVDQLSAAYGLGGRPRRTGSPAERARTAVTARIRDAIRRIEKLHPELGRHLRVSVRTGTLCSYEPDRPTPWTLT